MKKAIIVASAIFFSILFVGTFLVPVAGHAQEFNNEIGLYTDLSADPSSTSIMIDPNVLFDVYMLVTNPFNEEFAPPDCGTPIQQDIPIIDAFQFRLIIPEVGLLTMATTPNGIPSVWAGNPPEYAVGLEVPILVPENRVALLMTFTYMVLDSDPKVLFLEPTISFSQNGLAIYDASEYANVPCPESNRFQDVHPVSGDYAMPVFGINTSVVATESESWGSLKALYR